MFPAPRQHALKAYEENGDSAPRIMEFEPTWK
jgi:hypothetical protein